MTMNIEFRPIAEDDLKALRRWYDDRELARRVSYPTDEWFNYVNSGEIGRCWVARADQTVAQLRVDHVQGEPAYLQIAVRPDLRGRGLGRSILRGFLDGPGSHYGIIVGYIDPDNPASLRCCHHCGFLLSDKVNEDGFIRAELVRT